MNTTAKNLPATGTTVIITTGSRRTHNLRHLTGTVIGYDTQAIPGTECAAVKTIVRTPEGDITDHRVRPATTEEIAAATPAPAAEETRVQIEFRSVTCRRCDGEGRNPYWGRVAGGKCYNCAGAGRLLTRAGKEARLAFDKAITETLGTTYGQLEDDALFRFQGTSKIWRMGDRTAYPADTPVIRSVPATRAQIMRQIAAQYPTGATLI